MKVRLNSNMKNSNILHSSWLYAVATLVPALLGMLSISIFTRIFNAYEFGEYSLALNTSVFLSTLLVQWIQQSTQKYRPIYTRENKIDEFNGNLLKVLSQVSGVFLVVAVISYMVLKGFISIGSYYFPVVFLVVSNIFFLSFSTVLQSDFKVSRFKNISVLTSFFKLVLPLILLMTLTKSPTMILIGTAIVQFLFVANIYFKDLKPATLKKQNHDNYKSFKMKFIQFGLPMVGWFIANSIITLSDRYMLQIFADDRQVGIYSANYSLIIAGIGLLTRPILSVAHPELMNMQYETKEEKKRIELRNQSFTQWYFILTIPIFFFLLSYSINLVNIFLGQQFHEGYKILPVLYLSLLVWNAGLFGHKGFEILSKTKVMMMLVVCSAVINVILNLLVIPKYGYLGAAYASLLSMMTYPVSVYFLSKKNIPWKINFLSVIKTIIAGLVSFKVAYLITSSIRNDFIQLFLGFSIGTILYLILMILIKGITVPNAYEKRVRLWLNFLKS